MKEDTSHVSVRPILSSPHVHRQKSASNRLEVSNDADQEQLCKRKSLHSRNHRGSHGVRTVRTSVCLKAQKARARGGSSAG